MVDENYERPGARERQNANAKRWRDRNIVAVLRHSRDYYWRNAERIRPIAAERARKRREAQKAAKQAARQ